VRYCQKADGWWRSGERDMSYLRARVPAFTLGCKQTWLDADLEYGKFSLRGACDERSKQWWSLPHCCHQ
ncbi:hypothetical protein ACNRBS_20020, partial [Ralstonia pseudosolanacearum]|uniref:hypothetical protein n=1 Tax=Ralstonia pseudosolanacearum TaxID=1310165 RepID=UPI003AAE46DC